MKTLILNIIIITKEIDERSNYCHLLFLLGSAMHKSLLSAYCFLRSYDTTQYKSLLD
jgi:hypothetical protein